MSNPTEKKSGSDVVKSLQIANSLDYTVNRSLSVCKMRNWSKQPFSVGNISSVGPGKSVQRIISTSGSFVHGDASYLVFTAKLTGTVPTYTPAQASPDKIWHGLHGSGLNFIKEIEIRSKNSEPIEHIRHADIINNARRQYSKSSDWNSKFGSVLGIVDPVHQRLTEAHGDTNQGLSINKLTDAYANDGGYTYCIPLNMLSGLFRYKNLLPYQLMTGLSVNVTFNDFNAVFQRAGKFLDGAGPLLYPDANYEISDMYIRMGECQLSDSMSAKIARQSTDVGLKVLFDSYHHERQEITNNAQINVRKNIAQALALHCKMRPSSNLLQEDKDEQESFAYDYDRYQFFHGSQPYPTEAVTSPAEGYMQNQGAFGKIRESCCDNSISTIEYNNGDALVSYNFEKSHDMSLSGVSLSNSRNLTFQSSHSLSTPKIADLYLEYSVLLTAYAGNVVVEE